jgi:Siphovirus Gp157
MNLRKLESMSLEIIQMLLDSEGIYDQTLEQKMQFLLSNWADKVDEISNVIDALDEHAWMMQKKAAGYKEMASKMEKARDRLKSDLKQAMISTSQKAIYGDTATVKLSRSKSALHIDEELLPAQFFKMRVEEVPDRLMIENFIKENKMPIPGVEIKETWALRIIKGSIKAIISKGLSNGLRTK